MEKILIKNTDLEVAPLNLGGNVFGWTLDEKKSFEILDAFANKGYNFIDTADMYSYWVDGGSGGQSESIIGNWIKSRGNRDKVVIATKVGGETGVNPVDISKAHILKTVDESLKRLQTDYIDLYYTHYDDNKTPVEETLEAYDQLIKAGKIRHIAVSNITPERLIESFEVAEKNNLPKYVALQPHYNLVEREGFETNYAHLVKKYDLSVFTYWSLASGFLTGKYRSEADFGKSPRGGGAAKYMNEKGFAVLEALDKISAKHNTKQASVALAWLLANPLITAPIVSATSTTQLQALFEVPKLKLDHEDLNLLNTASK